MKIVILKKRLEEIEAKCQVEYQRIEVCNQQILRAQKLLGKLEDSYIKCQEEIKGGQDDNQTTSREV